jgi:predicted DNA-binding transcriptional regulator AlpA
MVSILFLSFFIALKYFVIYYVLREGKMNAELLTIKEVCEYMRISTVTFFRLRKKEENFPRPVLSNKKKLWKKSEIDEYLERTREKS